MGHVTPVTYHRSPVTCHLAPDQWPPLYAASAAIKSHRFGDAATEGLVIDKVKNTYFCQKIIKINTCLVNLKKNLFD